jgi:hypothetical protein
MKNLISTEILHDIVPGKRLAAIERGFSVHPVGALACFNLADRQFPCQIIAVEHFMASELDLTHAELLGFSTMPELWQLLGGGPRGPIDPVTIVVFELDDA